MIRTEFKLIDPKELEPLKDLIDSLMGKDTGKEDDPKGTHHTTPSLSVDLWIESDLSFV